MAIHHHGDGTGPLNHHPRLGGSGDAFTLGLACRRGDLLDGSGVAEGSTHGHYLAYTPPSVREDGLVANRRALTAWVVLATIVGGIAGAYLALTLATAHLTAAGAWLRAFAQSPGAAATAAVIAAGVALTGIVFSRRSSRETLDAQQATAAAESWWAMFEWASERAAPARREDVALPPSVTVATLRQLAATATSAVQGAACAGMIDMLGNDFGARHRAPSPSDETANPAGRDVGDDNDDESTLNAFVSYADDNRGTAAASAVAEGMAYLNSVSKALLSLSWAHPSFQVFRNPPPAGAADAIVEIDGRQVAVAVKRFRERTQLRNWLQHRAAERAHLPLVLVSPVSDPSYLPGGEPDRLWVVAWNTPDDNQALFEALQRASLDH